MKRVHRVVILPDYQGIGLGSQFVCKVAEMYPNNPFYIATTLKNFSKSLMKTGKFRLMNVGLNNKMSGKSTLSADFKNRLNETMRKVKICTLKYIGGKGNA
jgi:polynucleotide 5'-kinase involved in rRNA processing